MAARGSAALARVTAEAASRRRLQRGQQRRRQRHAARVWCRRREGSGRERRGAGLFLFDSKEGTLCLEDREPTFPFYVVGRAGAWKSGNRRDGWVRVTTGWTVRVLPELENSRTAVLATLHAFPTARLVPSRPARTAVFWSGCLSPAAIFRAHACAVKTRAQRVGPLDLDGRV